MMNRINIFIRKVVTCLLIISLSYHSIGYAYASTYTYKSITDFTNISSNAVITENGTLEITDKGIIIDGISYSKEEFKNALKKLCRLNDCSETNTIYEQTGRKNLILNNKNMVSGNRIAASGALYFLGQGIVSVFVKVTFALIMATIVGYCSYKVFRLNAGSLPNLQRSIDIVIKDTNAIYIDGIPVGLNWATLNIAEYISNSKENISILENNISSDDVDWGLNENQIHHIAYGSGSEHKNGWEKFGLDPDDPDFYSLILPLLKKAVDEGAIKIERFVDDGYIREFTYNISTKFQIWVRIFENSQGRTLSDATMNYFGQ